jgi:DNA-directed RNA polymerase subunit H
MSTQNSNVQISLIYQSRKIVLELMEQQGYNINDYALFNMSEVNTLRQNNQLDMLLETKNKLVTASTPSKKIYIRYYLTSRPAVRNIQDMIDDLFVLTETLKKTDILYIIVKDDANETLVNELKHIWEHDGIFIVMESIKRLQFNITKHILVPPHRVISEKEQEEIIKKYNIETASQLPEISRFDPVARAIGIRPGQVCHIIRDSKTSIEADYYRVCI